MIPSSYPFLHIGQVCQTVQSDAFLNFHMLSNMLLCFPLIDMLNQEIIFIVFIMGKFIYHLFEG